MELQHELILHKGIYFDFYLYIIWTICNGLFLYCKVDYLVIPSLLVVTAYILMIITFGLKLYLGKRRQFTSDMSSLTRFFLLTVLIQMPLVSFFLISFPIQLCTPIEVCLHVVLLLITLIESTISFSAVYKAVKKAANQSPQGIYFPPIETQTVSPAYESQATRPARFFRPQVHTNLQTDPGGIS